MLTTLPRGWDGYHGVPVTRANVQMAAHFLDRFLDSSSAAPWLVPLSGGGLQLEWHQGGLDIEVAYPADDVPEMYVRDLASGEEWEIDPESTDLDGLRTLASRLRPSR